MSSGILLNTINYGDTSLILKMLSKEHGSLSLIAKGYRNRSEPMHRLWEYEFQHSDIHEEKLCYLKEANPITDFSSYPSIATFSAAACGAELLSHITIPIDEASLYYQLITNYFQYLQKVKDNAFLVFLRLFMRVFHILGIDYNIHHCHICHREAVPFATDANAHLICAECFTSNMQAQYQVFSPSARHILKLLPEIGNHLTDIQLTQCDVKELSDLMINYYQIEHNNTLKLKSLHVLKQFYPKK